MTETTTAPTPPRSTKRWVTAASIAIVLLLAVIAAFVPNFNASRSREAGNRVQCACNLKQFSSALLLYANAHNGQYPDTLEQLVLSTDLSREVYVCPSTNDEPAASDTPSDIAASFSKPHHLSYLYFGSGLTTSAKADTVLVAEPLDNHAGDGTNILFADGHVDFCTRQRAKQILGDKLIEHR